VTARFDNDKCYGHGHGGHWPVAISVPPPLGVSNCPHSSLFARFMTELRGVFTEGGETGGNCPAINPVHEITHPMRNTPNGSVRIVKNNWGLANMGRAEGLGVGRGCPPFPIGVGPVEGAVPPAISRNSPRWLFYTLY